MISKWSSGAGAHDTPAFSPETAVPCTSSSHHPRAALRALGRDLPDRVGDRATLERHVQAWQLRRNAAATRADWQFTTNDARIKLRKLYPTMKGRQRTSTTASQISKAQRWRGV